MRHHLEPDDWAAERGTIFALYQELGVSREQERHRLQHAITGCSSLRYMTHEEHRKLIRSLEQITEKSVSDQQKLLRGLLALGSFDYRDEPEFDF